MSRRTTRTPAPRATGPSDSVQRGLASLCEFDRRTVIRMISMNGSGALDGYLRNILVVNNITAEQLLARFFDKSFLGSYCEQRLGLSSKGDAPVLAARIARAWAKPSFAPINVATVAHAQGGSTGDAPDVGNSAAKVPCADKSVGKPPGTDTDEGKAEDKASESNEQGALRQASAATVAPAAAKRKRGESQQD